MIKFFRKIRKKLLTENKFSRYLFYAIGEIVLVIIGILVALSVNNQNELRKEKIEEEKVLVGIKNDFLETRKGLRLTIYQQEEVIKYSQRLINLLEHEASTQNSDSIATYLTYGALSYWREEPVIGTYDALIGSGNTSLIKDHELLNSLVKFSAISKLPFEDEAYSSEILSLMTESISDYYYVLSAEGNRSAIGANYRYSEQDKQVAIKRLINNKSFLSFLMLRTNMEMNRLERQKSLLGLTKDILATYGINDIISSTEDVQKYIGNYEMTENNEVKVIVLAKENQLFLQIDEEKIKMFPDEQDSFFVPRFNRLIKFNIKNNSAIGFTFSRENEPDFAFKRVKQKNNR